MKNLNLTNFLIPLILFSFIDSSSFANQNAIHQNEETASPFKSSSLLEPPSGYAYIDQNEYADLNALPLELISEARHEFRKKEYSKAGQNIHLAAQIMKIQAEGNIKNSRLNDTATNLERLSERVSNNKLRSLNDLDSELTAAARAQAEHHYLEATEHWARHMIKNVGIELAASNSAMNRALEWSGRKVKMNADKAANSTEALSKKLVAGGIWSGDEVDKGLVYLDSEINHLDKKMEPKTKVVK